MTTIERPFQLSDQADAARFWFLDLIHNPRALPPLSADLFCLNSAFSPIGLDSRVVNGYVYNSPRTVGAPPAVPELPPGVALRNWETRYLPAVRAVYESLRDQPYAGMTAPEILAFFRSQLEPRGIAFGDTVRAAMEIGPEAERLAQFLEAKLGVEGDLISATLLHGSGSDTRSLGNEVQQLARDARRAPAVLAALQSRDFAAALASPEEPWASTLRQFLAAHEDEIALWSEIHEPAWNEDPLPLLRLVAATLDAGESERHDAAAAAMEQVRSRLAPADLPEFEAALAVSRDYVPVIEHRARWQLKLCGGVRKSVVALANRLVEEGALEDANDIFFVHYEELDAAVAGVLDARPLVASRRAEWREQLQLTPPLTLGLPVPYEMLGAVNPMMRRMFGAIAVTAPTATTIGGIGASGGVVRGRARVVTSLAEAEELQDGDILVCPSTSPPWSPYFAVVAAVVTDAGGMISHAAIEAREYGIPAVVGTREATRKIPEGATITVDGSAGTVTLEA